MTVSNIHWKHLSLNIYLPSAVEVFTTLRYINVHLFTYLLTYLLSRRCTTDRKTPEMDRQHHGLDWIDSILSQKIKRHETRLYLAPTVACWPRPRHMKKMNLDLFTRISRMYLERCPPVDLIRYRFACSWQGRSVATGGIWVYIPPKSAQVNFLWGKMTLESYRIGVEKRRLGSLFVLLLVSHFITITYHSNW